MATVERCSKLLLIDTDGQAGRAGDVAPKLEGVIEMRNDIIVK